MSQLVRQLPEMVRHSDVRARPGISAVLLPSDRRRDILVRPLQGRGGHQQTLEPALSAKSGRV